MRLTMEQKRAVTAKQAARYRGQKDRKGRGQVLDEVQRLTDYNRHYAAWLLRRHGTVRLMRLADGTLLKLVVGQRNPHRPARRTRIYDHGVKKHLIEVWDCFDQMCGKRLVAVLPQMLEVLAKKGKLKRTDAAYGKLARISASTIDRLLRDERARRRLKGMTHTRPSTALKNSIPVVISSELNRDEPGHYQMDLVGHEGGNPNGHFAFTLTAVELYSGWVEPRALLNRARRWVRGAVERVKNEAPVAPKSIHSDNDSSFLNEPLQSWCAEQGIAFRRARPYHSNDTCYVEQKNFNIVRQAVGYARYETEQEVELLDRLYGKLRLLINFFYPSVKLLEKERINGRIRKRYDKPQTPATRLLECAAVPSAVKRRLRQQLTGMDPLELKRQIDVLQTKLLQLVRRKNLKIVYPGPPYPQATERLMARLKATR
jgi:hypothetical protein